MQWSARVPGPASFEDAAFARIRKLERGESGAERIRRAGGRLHCLEPGTQACVGRMFAQMGSGMRGVAGSMLCGSGDPGSARQQERPEIANSKSFVIPAEVGTVARDPLEIKLPDQNSRG